MNMVKKISLQVLNIHILIIAKLNKGHKMGLLLSTE